MTEKIKPKNLDQCMVVLAEELTIEERLKFDRLPKSDVVLLHHNLGRWMRNEWGLWAKEGAEEELLLHMRSLGFRHADDMSNAILMEYWNRMHGEKSQIKEQAEEARKYWEGLGNVV